MSNRTLLRVHLYNVKKTKTKTFYLGSVMIQFGQRSFFWKQSIRKLQSRRACSCNSLESCTKPGVGTASDVACILLKVDHLQISEQMASTQLSQGLSGLTKKKKKKKKNTPLLRQLHMNKRMAWAKNHKKWIEEYFGRTSWNSAILVLENISRGCTRLSC